jgi:hypothetical protein
MVAPDERWRNTIALKLLGNKLKRQKRKMFFSEEKAAPARREPKDFYFSAVPKIEAMAGTLPQAQI